VILRLDDSAYTERLASFLRSVGQEANVAGESTVALPAESRTLRAEMEIYLRVWAVLYPDAAVTIEDE
jgi:hypothetical protein